MIGLKVIHQSRVHEVRDEGAAAALVASFYPEPSRVRACETLTRDRPLTAAENQRIADQAARALVRDGRI